MAPRLLGHDEMSEVFDHSAREDCDFPLVLERLRPPGARRGLLQSRLQALAQLGRPFRRVVDVRELELVTERFIGITGRELFHALNRSNRVLPIDVWLALAKNLCDALEVLPLEGPVSQFVISPTRFGVDLRRQFQVFPHVLHSALIEARGDAAYSLAPESSEGHHDARSRVFSIAVTLVLFLTGDSPGRRRITQGPAVALFDSSLHPWCTPELAAVISSALEGDPTLRPASPSELFVRLTEAARCEPASSERLALVMLGAQPERWKVLLDELGKTPELLPPSWRGGGLAVLEDQLLEATVPIDRLELSRKPPPQPRSGPPRFNLASTPKAPWWQSLWPFGK